MTAAHTHFINGTHRVVLSCTCFDPSAPEPDWTDPVPVWVKAAVLIAPVVLFLVAIYLWPSAFIRG